MKTLCIISRALCTLFLIITILYKGDTVIKNYICPKHILEGKRDCLVSVILSLIMYAQESVTLHGKRKSRLQTKLKLLIIWFKVGLNVVSGTRKAELWVRVMQCKRNKGGQNMSWKYSLNPQTVLSTYICMWVNCE